jgi:hypothetical protein
MDKKDKFLIENLRFYFKTFDRVSWQFEYQQTEKSR